MKFDLGQVYIMIFVAIIPLPINSIIRAYCPAIAGLFVHFSVILEARADKIK